MARPAPALACICAGLLAGAGCGGGGEVEEGSTVTVYAGASVCAAAKREVGRSGPEAGSARVRVICTPATEVAGRLELATAGANARRAAEDSRSVGYVEAPGAATRFIRPILEEPEIALVVDGSGADGVASILRALDSRGGDESPRESVWVHLE